MWVGLSSVWLGVTLAPRVAGALLGTRRRWRPGSGQPVELCGVSTYSRGVPTLLHISDLHRTADPRVGNDELLTAMSSDSARWESEGIPRPDLLVVSGDLVQGVGMAVDDPDSDLEAQYAEARDLLDGLAAEFLDSDRTRVVIVPGNHDVHWGRARSAMTRLSDCPPGIARKALRPDSMVRWDWEDQHAYQITDNGLYDSRFEHFRRFRTDFYSGLESGPAVHENDLIAAEYGSLGLVVVGFASWYGNDCFCRVGEIDRSALAASQRLLTASTAPIAVAVWHHGLDGGPQAQDYMDRRAIHKLIDYGFSLGLHGHQHYPGAAPFELRLPNLTSMAVIGAGSLAVGDDELPAGELRQFNIVVVDPDSESVKVHVRAMSPAGVFLGSPRADFGGETSITLKLAHSPVRPERPTATLLLDEAMTATRLGEFEKALELVPKIVSPAHSSQKRKIEVEALEGLGRHEALLDLIRPPQSPDEAIRAISLLVDSNRFDEAELELKRSSGLLNPAIANDLAAHIAGSRMLL